MDLYQTTGISPNADDEPSFDSHGDADGYGRDTKGETSCGYSAPRDSWRRPHLTARPYFDPNGLDSGKGRTLPLHEPPNGWAMPTPPPDGDDEHVCRFWGATPAVWARLNERERDALTTHYGRPFAGPPPQQRKDDEPVYLSYLDAYSTGHCAFQEPYPTWLNQARLMREEDQSDRTVADFQGTYMLARGTEGGRIPEYLRRKVWEKPSDAWVSGEGTRESDAEADPDGAAAAEYRAATAPTTDPVDADLQSELYAALEGKVPETVDYSIRRDDVEYTPQDMGAFCIQCGYHLLFCEHGPKSPERREAARQFGRVMHERVPKLTDAFIARQQSAIHSPDPMTASPDIGSRKLWERRVGAACDANVAVWQAEVAAQEAANRERAWLHPVEQPVPAPKEAAPAPISFMLTPDQFAEALELLGEWRGHVIEDVPRTVAERVAHTQVEADVEKWVETPNYRLNIPSLQQTLAYWQENLRREAEERADQKKAAEAQAAWLAADPERRRYMQVRHWGTAQSGTDDDGDARRGIWEGIGVCARPADIPLVEAWLANYGDQLDSLGSRYPLSLPYPAEVSPQDAGLWVSTKRAADILDIGVASVRQWLHRHPATPRDHMGTGSAAKLVRLDVVLAYAARQAKRHASGACRKQRKGGKRGRPRKVAS